MTTNPSMISLCLSGLERMYIPAEHMFCASYRPTPGEEARRRDPTVEYRYSLLALLGLHCAKAAGNEIFLDPPSDYRHIALGIEEHASPVENIAVTVWVGKRLGVEVPTRAMELFDKVLQGCSSYAPLTATDLAWMIVASGQHCEAYFEAAFATARIVQERYLDSSRALVMQSPTSYRRDFAKFAASCYMAYAFLYLGRLTGSDWAKNIGLKIARALVKLQGPHGQWGWLYHVPSGKVANYYPVYTVHQHSMAPFFLLEAIDQGYDEFREPLCKSINWITGHNEYGETMVDRSSGLIWRSVQPKKRNSKPFRVAKALSAAYLGLRPRMGTGSSLEINRESRCYELGWALFVLSGRHDFDYLLEDVSFRS